MKKTIKGRVLRLGDNVDTDVIAPGRWKSEGLDVLARHSMEAVRKDFYKEIKPGDILVAGRNFGCGSHREEATIIMQHLGFAAVCADSVARIYYRNGISYGLPIIGAQGISHLADEGDEIEIEFQDDCISITNTQTKEQITAPAIPETMLRVMEAGGIYPLLKMELEKEKNES